MVRSQSFSGIFFHLTHTVSVDDGGIAAREMINVPVHNADHDFREHTDELKLYMPTVKPRPGQGMPGKAHAVGGKGRLIFLTLVVVWRYHTRVVSSDSVPRP